MIRVFIVDDHAVVRAGLKQILSEELDIEVVGEASDGQTLLDKVREDECDVIVLDIGLPGASGLDVLKQLRKQKSALRVLVLSMHPEEQYAVRVLKAGASGYITKDKAPEELIQAIHTVSQGRKYITSTLAERLAFLMGEDAEKALHEKLSDREFQVLRLIASGKQTKKIAEEMCLSVKTISTYRARILSKMGMKNNAELTHYAMSNRLLD